ncbi:MAG: 23S rRNA (pseudouridine(1915)-N(3))-methyltransferase RlmH [Methylocapsa sp.]|nr:23S rRNA (pseudouridine(1915)-N(3))-methyltransferase RlmH [Methylocapsa sp.]
MRLLLCCVGRLKAGPERELVARYIERAAAAGPALGFAKVALREVAESRAARAADRKREEARALCGLWPPDAAIIAFDESGRPVTSRDFAAVLARLRDEGRGCAALAIGGPDGLDESLVAAVPLGLSLGPMTWPHQLARIMAAEQMYRAITILAKHPYHRD